MYKVLTVHACNSTYFVQLSPAEGGITQKVIIRSQASTSRPGINQIQPGLDVKTCFSNLAFTD